MRRIRRMSLQEAARGALSHQHLSRIERGDHYPTLDTLEKLAKNLRTSVQFLAKGPNPPSGNPEREMWILDFFGRATTQELRELFADQPPAIGRKRMRWLLEKTETYGHQRLKTYAERLIEIQAERARSI